MSQEMSRKDVARIVEANRDRVEESIRTAEAEVASGTPMSTLDEVLGESDDSMSMSFSQNPNEHTLTTGKPGNTGFVEFEPDPEPKRRPNPRAASGHNPKLSIRKYPPSNRTSVTPPRLGRRSEPQPPADE